MGRDGTGGDVAWKALLSAREPSAQRALAALRAESAALEQARPELGVLAGPRCRTEAGHRWLRYKEAFSPGLVQAILDNWSQIDGPLLDPFAGTGTSLLVASARGVGSVGVELLPYAQWSANTVLSAHRADGDVLEKLVRSAVSSARRRRRVARVTLPVPAAEWALPDHVLMEISNIRAALPQRGGGVEVDLAHLALLSIVESVSSSVKDGTSLRHREPRRAGLTTRPGRKGQTVDEGQVIQAFAGAAQRIVDDLPKMPTGTDACVLLGDARHLPLAAASAGAAVFSPPYPNRYDYSAIYQLELAVGGFIHTSDELRKVRKSLLRSHLEAPAPVAPAIDDVAVRGALRNVAVAAEGGPAERGRTLRMLVGYFDDMGRVLHELARVLRPGAPTACVVGTQTYFGAPVPTDLMLAALARRSGFTVEGLWILRHKRVAVQQRARGVTTAGGREVVLFLRRSHDG